MNGKPHRSDETELLRQHDLATLRLDPPDDIRLQQDALNRLATLARQLFLTRAGAVSIVGRDRLWFVGTAGMEPGERARDHTLCDRVITRDGVTVIPDTSQDPKCGIPPGLTGDQVLFYAGAPICSREGARIGAVCVWDDNPRSRATDAEGYAALIDLAALAADIVELRREDQTSSPQETPRQRQASDALLRALGLCCVVFDREMRITLASPAFCALMGRPAQSLIGLSLAGLLEVSLSGEQLQRIENDQLTETAVWRLRTYGHRIQTMECEISPAQGGEPLFVARLRHPQRRQPATRQSGPHMLRILGQLRDGRDPVGILRSVLKMVAQDLDACKAIVSLRSRPGQRILLGQAENDAFCESLERHHRFEPSFSICATTCESGHSTISADTRLEHRWPNFGWLDLAYGIRAVWSTPIHSAGRNADAALTLFRTKPGEPSAAQMAILREAAAVAALAVERLDIAALSREFSQQTRSVDQFMAMFPGLSRRIPGEGQMVAHAIALSDEQLQSGLDLPWAGRMIRQATGDAAILVRLDDRRMIVVSRADGEDGLRAQREQIRRQLRIDAVRGGRSQCLQGIVASLPVAGETEAPELLARLTDALNGYPGWS